MAKKKTLIWISLLAGTVIPFVLFLIGVGGVLGASLQTANILAFAVTSLVIGGFFALFAAFRWNIASVIFALGVLVGFVLMFVQFGKGTGDGFSDLAGLLSMFMFAVGGLILGVVVQVLVLIFRKARQRKE